MTFGTQDTAAPNFMFRLNCQLARPQVLFNLYTHLINAEVKKNTFLLFSALTIEKFKFGG